MAKDTAQAAGVQYKVLVKPTDVGLLVMRRMQRPHIDKSAELRRFVELGYAAEQAGFILDGTVLRHAGRIWDVQPDFAGQSQGGAGQAAELRVRESIGQQAIARKNMRPDTGPHGSSEVPPEAKVATDTADGPPDGKSAMRDKLRNLSR